MEKCVCKIILERSEGTGISTGFFCKIPFPDKNNMLPVLITGDLVEGENIFPNEICININKEKFPKIINLNNRMKYINKEFIFYCNHRNKRIR